MHVAQSNLALLGLITLLGFYAGRLVRTFRLPTIMGCMLFGVLAGPSLFGLLSHHQVQALSFVNEVTLGLVAFSLGSNLRLAALRRLGSSILAVIVCLSLAAFLTVLVAVYLLTKDLALALIFASLAPATSPAGTLAIIQGCRARGTLTSALYAVVGTDDSLAILIFAFAATFAQELAVGGASGAGTLSLLITPLQEIGASLFLGALLGFFFSRIVSSLRDSASILTVLAGVVLLGSGLSVLLRAPLILTNLVAGFMLANLQGPSVIQKVSAQLRGVIPFFFVLFFSLAGAHLDLAALPSLGALGLVYIVARCLGVVGGARLGAVVGGAEEKIRDNLGLAVLCQAGVVIGLALMVDFRFSQLGSAHAARIGTTVITTITATSVFFEIVGPLLTRHALQRAGEGHGEGSGAAH